jgi:two-component system phosphate regulon response regulator PhoB
MNIYQDKATRNQDLKLMQEMDKGPAKPTILIVKDNFETEDILKANARMDIYNVQIAEGGATALLMAPRICPNLIVLDIHLSKVRWTEFYRSIRQDSKLEHTPILISTNSADAVFNLAEFGLGNTDFIVKPFKPRELVLRMRRLLWPRQNSENIETNTLTYSDLQLDVSRYEVEVDGSEVHLTTTEFKLLATLAQRQGRVQSREILLQDVFAYNTSDIETRTIDTHMRRLRQKLGSAQWHLETVRGVGYRFRDKSISQTRMSKLRAGRRHSVSRHSITRG